MGNFFCHDQICSSGTPLTPKLLIRVIPRPFRLPLHVQLFSKGEDQTLLDAMREYVDLVKPDLVIIASKGLCEFGAWEAGWGVMCDVDLW